MAKRDDAVALRQMLDYGREIVAFSQSRSRIDLESDRLYQLAMVRLIEILGEAASRISQSRQAQLPQIPWREIIDARNYLAHGYDSIDYDVIWQIIQSDLPPLISALEEYLGAQ